MYFIVFSVIIFLYIPYKIKQYLSTSDYQFKDIRYLLGFLFFGVIAVCDFYISFEDYNGNRDLIASILVISLPIVPFLICKFFYIKREDKND